MSYLVKMGAIASAKDQYETCFNQKEMDEQRGWNEGFVNGLHEAGAITDEEMWNIIEELKKIFTAPRDLIKQKWEQLTDEEKRMFLRRINEIG